MTNHAEQTLTVLAQMNVVLDRCDVVGVVPFGPASVVVDSAVESVAPMSMLRIREVVLEQSLCEGRRDIVEAMHMLVAVVFLEDRGLTLLLLLGRLTRAIAGVSNVRWARVHCWETQ